MAARKEILDLIMMTRNPQTRPSHELVSEQILKIVEIYSERKADTFTLKNDLFELVSSCEMYEKCGNKNSMDIESTIMILFQSAKDWGVLLPDEEIRRYEKVKLCQIENLAQYIRDLYARKPELPKELNNDKAKKYFKKAVKLGLIDNDYNWLKGLQMLACFAKEMSIRLKLGKGERISWKPFEILFNIPRGKLRLNYNDIQKTGNTPTENNLIDAVFE